MVAKLAEAQGITGVVTIEDVVPLLFEHTMYKSYPPALLERQRFDQLTEWLNKLTAVDLSAVKAADCDAIDTWLTLLFDEAQLDVGFSSGTSGTMSFFPWSVRDLEVRARATHVAYVQRLGEDGAWQEPFHFIAPGLRYRRNYLHEVMAQGEGGHCHMRNQGLSADLGWLAARLRLAAARGDATRVRVPPNLLSRRGELEELQTRDGEVEEAWTQEVKGLQGQRVFWLAYPADLYGLAAAGLERRERWAYSPDSSLLLIGGPKGSVLPPDWRDTIERFLDISIRTSYGMVEMSSVAVECTRGQYHLAPWIIPFVLDPVTSDMLPRAGVQRGRAAYFDLLPTDHWGGFITGDEIEVDFDTACGCGATTYHIAPDVLRLSDRHGGDDKITCAATPEAHAEAMEFLVGH
jgi:hypothetical protein